MFRSKAQTITTTRALLLDPRRGTASKHQLYAIRNTDPSAIVYLGGDDVTTANGFPVLPDEAVTVPVAGREQLYAVATATAEVRVLGSAQDGAFE